MTVFASLRLLKKTGNIPKRTIRFIAWSGQESNNPVDAAAQYQKVHHDEMPKHIVGFESDLSSAQLTGFGHIGVGEEIIKNIVSKYMSLIDTGIYSDDGGSADVTPLYEQGGVLMLRNLPRDIPAMQLQFRYHHTAGDSMSIMNSDEMDSNVLGIAGMLYILADLDKTLRDVP